MLNVFVYIYLGIYDNSFRCQLQSISGRTQLDEAIVTGLALRTVEAIVVLNDLDLILTEEFIDRL